MAKSIDLRVVIEVRKNMCCNRGNELKVKWKKEGKWGKGKEKKERESAKGKGDTESTTQSKK